MNIKFVKKLSAVIIALTAIVMLLCSCGKDNDENNNDTTEYEYLKTDVIGMWVDESGPVTVNSPIFGESLAFYEFTSDNKIYYHYMYLDEQGLYNDGCSDAGTYRIDGNMLVYEKQNAGAYIDIADEVMTMTNNNGSKKYEKITVEEATSYNVYYNDPVLDEQQQALIAERNEKAAQETSAAVSEAAAE
ncbi:MAG: hypothetical protein IJ446_08215 [Oscillospiraceae bacterium]|nr:hypothetical protein [Oscillospiraceae bacterium]